MNDGKKLLTTGELAKMLGCPLWKLQYILASRRIQPSQRVGHLRVFETDIVGVLEKELQQMSRRIRHAAD
ncbi:MAG: hypothetical protein A2Y13_12415 [Planctomycetes bacterium GWC2_45_44]|nr:MAG: hypothetical protein A2Y13_12415 [Planctomycetes bacterium GWC2_45_44]HBR18737.1 hypothetical protein [Phycisphaerales bacterium]